VVEGADKEYGVNSDGFVTEGEFSSNVGSRTFLMADDYFSR
jgi:hypothetical protein